MSPQTPSTRPPSPLPTGETPHRDVVALVESPAQLLNVIEWAHARCSTGDGEPQLSPHRIGAGATVVVLAPAQAAGREQLRAMAGLARSVGFAVVWYDLRGSAAGRLSCWPGLLGWVRAARTLVVGDPFSGPIQLLLGASTAREVVVVDDGSATFELVELLARGDDLIRWHRGGRAGAVRRRVARTATRRLTPRRKRPVSLFTAMPVHSPVLPVLPNRLAWTRRSFGPPTVLPGADLIGTSLVESGVIGLSPYLRAVGGLTRSHGLGRYLAHRRESEEKLRRIADLGLEVVRPELPLEIVARTGPIRRTMISFPSTVVHTLPPLIAEVGARVLVCEIDRDWFVPAQVDGSSAGFLSGVSDAARRAHGLATVGA
ncbi:hypothetical protein FHX74_002787 [Friedmanniella endophytica]|uniref:Uncharacterized protein n=1 Tax=Microlunatus kandeliicorticis TaxID=1759536 RepID=A0A7W3ITW1_9ACTN|nr:hypothetical protein [Microlunatus kandeliicorticis]MBA8795159.1 hypothetical protein [Microlunatus kandeliicorticis]